MGLTVIGFFFLSQTLRKIVLIQTNTNLIQFKLKRFYFRNFVLIYVPKHYQRQTNINAIFGFFFFFFFFKINKTMIEQITQSNNSMKTIRMKFYFFRKRLNTLGAFNVFCVLFSNMKSY